MTSNSPIFIYFVWENCLNALAIDDIQNLFLGFGIIDFKKERNINIPLVTMWCVFATFNFLFLT